MIKFKYSLNLYQRMMVKKVLFLMFCMFSIIPFVNAEGEIIQTITNTSIWGDTGGWTETNETVNPINGSISLKVQQASVYVVGGVSFPYFTGTKTIQMYVNFTSGWGGNTPSSNAGIWGFVNGSTADDPPYEIGFDSTCGSCSEDKAEIIYRIDDTRISSGHYVETKKVYKISVTHDYTGMRHLIYLNNVLISNETLGDKVNGDSSFTFEDRNSNTYILDGYVCNGTYCEIEGDVYSTDLFFKNESGINKTSFKEGEVFNPFINYTLNNVPVTNLSGDCNITMSEMVLEREAPDNNFSICDIVSCDYDSHYYFNESWNTDNAVQDMVHFYGCYNNLIGSVNEFLNVSLKCGSNSYTEIFNRSSIPLCSNGNPFIFVNTSVCSAFDSVNYSLTHRGEASESIQIYDLSSDRQYNNYVFDDEIRYNDTSELWYLNQSMEFYDSALINVSAQCGSGVFDNETITIVDIPPRVFINSFIYGTAQTDLYNGVVVEFKDGSWVASVSVIDNELQNVSLNIYNGSGNNVFNSGSYGAVPFLSDLFVEFQNPYNISLWANDTNGNTGFVSLLFNWSDSIPPSFNLLSGGSGVLNDNYTLNMSMNDEYLWFFNLSCSGVNYNFSMDEIASQSYYHDHKLVLNNNITCFYEVCDGHTDMIMEPIDIIKVAEMNKMFIGNEDVSLSVDVSEINTYEFKEKIEFEFILKEQTDFFYVTVSEGFVQAPYSEYKGHFVNTQTREWLDFEGDYDIEVLGNTVFIRSDKPIDNFKFNSVGRLNCINGTFNINATEKSADVINFSGCYFDYNPYIKDFEWVCFIENADNMTFDCVTQINYEGAVLQTNPNIKGVEGVGLINSFRAEPVGASSQMVHVFFTEKDIRPDLNVTAKMVCTNNLGNNTVLEYNLTPSYKDWYEVIDYSSYAKDNMFYIIGFVGFLIAFSLTIGLIFKVVK